MGNTQGTTNGNEQDLTQTQLQQLGNDQQQQEPIDEYDFNYTQDDLEYIESKEMDEAYGEIRVYRIKNSAGEVNPEDPEQRIPEDLEVCTKTKIFDSKEDCKEYFNDLEDKKRLIHPHLVRLVKCQTVMNSNFCTNIYKIDMAFEYIRHSLETEILNRFKSQEYFDENSIFDLLEHVLSCLYYLNSQGVSHGDIQPRTILIDNFANFKITDIRFLTSGMCGYRKHLAGIETECFLAPELLTKLRRQTILDNEEVDQERADVFSLGLVALAMATLQSVDIIYNFDEYSLKEEEIQNLLENVKTNYSHNLYLLLASMLNHVDKRLDFESALNLIDQMRNDQFNQEEYERRRFQTELENSERKLVESEHTQQGQFGGVISEYPDAIQDFEAPKRSKQQPDANNNVDQQQALALQQEQYLQQQLLQEQQQQQQAQQAAGVAQNTDRQEKPNNSAQQISTSQVNSQPQLSDIEQRVREALLRSQQVSMKFENSPLRMFRDQLLADELYVPLDPNFANHSVLHKSKNLETSGRKTAGSHVNNSGIQNSKQFGFTAKPNQTTSSKNLTSKKSQQQQRPLNEKWKI